MKKTLLFVALLLPALAHAQMRQNHELPQFKNLKAAPVAQPKSVLRMRAMAPVAATAASSPASGSSYAPFLPQGGISHQTDVPEVYADGSTGTLAQIGQMADGSVQQADIGKTVAGLGSDGRVTASGANYAGQVLTNVSLTGTSTSQTWADRISATMIGGGINGPQTAMVGHSVNVTKQNWNSTTATPSVGEMDGVYVFSRQGGATSDSSGYLADVAGTGEGFLNGSEFNVSQIVNNVAINDVDCQSTTISAASGRSYGNYCNLTKKADGVIATGFSLRGSGVSWDYLMSFYDTIYSTIFTIKGDGTIWSRTGGSFLGDINVGYYNEPSGYTGSNINIGAPAQANTSKLNFRTSGTQSAYDANISVTGGGTSASDVGKGTMTLNAGSVVVNAPNGLTTTGALSASALNSDSSIVAVGSLKGSSLHTATSVIDGDLINGSIDIGNLSLASATPYFNFNGFGTNNNFRLINDADGQLSFKAKGATVATFNGSAGAFFPTAGATNFALGKTGVASSEAVKFRTSGTAADYDAWILVSGGAASPGTGDLSIRAGSVTVNAPFQTTQNLWAENGFMGSGTGPTAQLDGTGGYSLAWNQAGTSTGETDFVNVYGAGSGGFNWYNTTAANWQASTKPAPEMNLSPTGFLFVSGGYKIPGKTKAEILALTNYPDGTIVNDSDDHVPVVYENGHWYPLHLGAALAD